MNCLIKQIQSSNLLIWILDTSYICNLWHLLHLRVPWTARRSNQSIVKEISPEYSLEWQMLKLNLQYFGHLMWISDSLEKTLMLGRIEGRRRRGRQRMRWLDVITNSMYMSLSKLGVGDGQGSLVCCTLWDHRVRHNWATELNWTDTCIYIFILLVLILWRILTNTGEYGYVH